MLTRRAVGLSLLASGAAPAALAQTFPDQPVRIVAPFAPGGPADTISRAISGVMGQRLGRPVVVENRTGAGGALGVEHVARSRPDGYSMVLGSNGALVILPHLMPNFAYDPLRDLAPVSLILTVPQILVARKTLAVQSLQDLIAEAKRRPGALSYGSTGTGTAPHLATELIRLRAGITITHVPYRGAAPALTDLIAGHIDFMVGDLTVLLPQIRAGAVTAIAIAAPQRSPALPEVPTTAEGGLPGVESEGWYALFAPAGTPADRIARLQQAARAAVTDPATAAPLQALGTTLVGGTPEELAALLRSEFTKWGGVVREAQIKLE
jgi:tripartite-type tricarboxylate transporter receptor subunit TctC